MAKFWFLIAAAAIDLVIAIILANAGYGPVSFLFLLMALILGVYAFIATPRVRRDARGRLHYIEIPNRSVLGTLGVVAMATCAGYLVFAISGAGAPGFRQPGAMASPQAPVSPGTGYLPPRSFSPEAASAALYKCVDRNRQTSIQSQPCPPGSEQVWVRDATPELPPSPAQRARQDRALAARPGSADQASMRSRAPGSPGQPGDPGASAACRAARAADAAYRRRPLSQITHDGLRWHGDRILEACY